MRVFITIYAVLIALFLTESTGSGQSVRPGWAAVTYEDASGTGVTFRVWAPNATNVHVGGTFNGWNASSHPLVSEGTSGVWSADFEGLSAGASYAYIINNTDWKQDPRGQLFDTSNTKNPVIMEPSSFDWGTVTNPARMLEDMIIYEMHPGTFFDVNPDDDLVGTLSNAVAGLDYISGMGFNTVQLMPVHEYPGDTSWGYNPIYPHSVARPYGGPGGLKTFVKACHERGMSVLMDVVHNHWGPGDLSWGLWQFDGWAPDPLYGGLYFYNTAPLATTPWGVTRPNFNEQGVRDYIRDSFILFLKEYRVDGFRWDTPYQIARDNNNSVITEGESLIAEILAETFSNYPHVVHISENAEFLPGFNGYWDHTPSKELGVELVKTNDAWRNMSDIEAFILPDPALTHVRYSESHDLVGGLNSRTRIPSQIDPADPFSYNARKRSALGGILTFTGQSVPMVFQGQCMYETHHFSSRYPIRWEYTNTYKESVALYRDIIALRNNTGGVTGGLSGDETDILHLDHTDKIVAYRRGGADERQDCVVLVNLTEDAITDYELPLPGGMWFTHFNSDDPAYGADYTSTGSRMVFAPRNPALAARVTVAPYSALVLSKLQGSINMIDAVLDDSTDGNGNGQVDPAEVIYDYPVLVNLGDAALTNVRLTIGSPHEDVMILSNEVSFGSIAAGETVTHTSGFAYQTDRSLPCGTSLIFPVLIETEGHAPFTSFYGRVAGELTNCVTNAGPVIADAGITVTANSWTNGYLTLYDAEGDDIQLDLLHGAEHGVFSVDTNTGGFGYTPVRGYSGTDAVDIAARDRFGSGPPTNLPIEVVPLLDTDNDGLPDDWEQLYFGNPTNAQPHAHGDDDEVDNLNEFLAGTAPNDSTSFLRILGLGPWNETNMLVAWVGRGGVRYRFEKRVDPAGDYFGDVLPAEIEMIRVQPNLTVGTYRILPLNDALGSYRIRVINE